VPKAQHVYRRFLDGPDGADVKELAIHRRVSRLNYSRRCAEASAMQAHMKQGLPLAPEMEIGYVVRDASYELVLLYVLLMKLKRSWISWTACR